MTTKTLLLATTGLLTPIAMQAAEAAPGQPTQTKVLAAPVNDLARVSNGRLRMTDEEQPGNEMAVVLCERKTGKVCRYFSMNTELPPLTPGGPVRPANHRVQLSMTKVDLAQDASGSVIANADAAGSIYLTDNDGNEYRNANHPNGVVFDEEFALITYNYQAQNTNDTKRYGMVVNITTGDIMMQQSLIMAKNNDDCSMNASGKGLIKQTKVGTRVYFLLNAGCNGNGEDDTWGEQFSIDTATWTLRKEFDLSINAREERAHGTVSVLPDDPNTAIFMYTSGNTQPQRDGCWAVAVDVTPGKFQGAGRQEALLWKEQIGGREDINGQRTYCMRVSHQPILNVAANGDITDSKQLITYYNQTRGNNNNNEKGGTVHATKFGVIEADKTGLRYVQPMADQGTLLKGVGGTHLHVQEGFVGTAGALTPALFVARGSHTGGYAGSTISTLTYNPATGKFATGGTVTGAPWDRHLYPNYLGNNPGNQGRNYGHSIVVKNPYLGVNGNTATHLMLMATTGKPMDEMGKPELKASAFLTVIPIAEQAANGNGSGSGSDNGNGNTDPTDPSNPSAGESLGGCSTGGATGLGSLLLLGLVGLIRRRR